MQELAKPSLSEDIHRVYDLITKFNIHYSLAFSLVVSLTRYNSILLSYSQWLCSTRFRPESDGTRSFHTRVMMSDGFLLSNDQFDGLLIQAHYVWFLVQMLVLQRMYPQYISTYHSVIEKFSGDHRIGMTTTVDGKHDLVGQRLPKTKQ